MNSSHRHGEELLTRDVGQVWYQHVAPLHTDKLINYWYHNY